MWILGTIAWLCCLLGIAVFYARQDAKKSARIEALKQEAREEARVQTIRQYVGDMPLSDVRRRLRGGKD